MLGGRSQDPATERARGLRREAIAWLSLLSSGTATTADAEALKHWCNENPEHRQAYAHAALTWDMLSSVAVPTPETSRLLRPEPVRHAIGRRAVLGGMLSASAACAAYAVIHPPFELWPSLAEFGADVRTGTGEQRRIPVAKGVAIDLNTRSSVTWQPLSSGAGNYIKLISGEAVVAAGPDAVGPCVVAAGVGRIVARDARVDIRHEGSRIRVVCLDGNVRVEHQVAAVTLPAGEQVIYDNRNISGTGAVDPAVVSAWQQGRLIFQREALARVVDEVNRYRPGRIVLMDRSLGERLIDASFNLDRLDNVIVYIHQAFEARITKLPGGLVLIG